MSNHVLSETSGIDCEIKNLQEDIYTALGEYFSKIDGFGRIYKHPGESGFIPKRYDANKRDYEDVYLDDRVDCSFCFIDGDSHDTEDGLLYKAPVKIVFWMDLEVLSKDYRADAEAHRIAASILKDDCVGEFEFKGIDKTVNTVFTGFNTQGIHKDDLQPYHVFALNIDLSYYLTKKC